MVAGHYVAFFLFFLDRYVLYLRLASIYLGSI
jgi:hypothetical protein